MSLDNISEIETQVKQILAEKLDVDIKKVTNDALLGSDLGIDSFGSIELIFELEDRFNIEVPENDLANVTTVKDVIEYITQRLLK